MTTFIYLLALCLFMILCAVLCFVILIQDSKSSGLGASFGGDAGDSLFGTSTADVLKKFTGWLAVAFLASCVVMSVWTSAMSHKSNGRAPLIEEVEAE